MTEETRTLQLWPAGKSVTVRGDCAAAGALEIRTGLATPKWRPATEQERRAVHVEELAESYAEHDILYCDSMLVDALLKAEFDGFGAEDIENLYPNPSEWDVRKCQEWLNDYGYNWPSDEDALQFLAQAVRDDHDPTLSDEKLKKRGYYEYILAESEESFEVDDWREAVTDNAEAVEVFEWWRVTDHLCRELRDIGEVVFDNDYGCWWGRSCTGQQLITDGVLQQVAEQHV